MQYWYEGDEAGDLPVDFSIVWDGDFFIDKPSSMKGNLQQLCGDTRSLLLPRLCADDGCGCRVCVRSAAV